jgi:hypothetical protein
MDYNSKSRIVGLRGLHKQGISSCNELKLPLILLLLGTLPQACLLQANYKIQAL